MQPRIRKELAERIKADALSMGVTDSEMIHLILTWYYFPNPNNNFQCKDIPTETKPKSVDQTTANNDDDFDSLLDDF